MPLPEPALPAPGANARGAIPGHARMPEAVHLHHLRPTLRGMQLEVIQHVDDVLTGRHACLGIIRPRDNPIVAGGCWHMPFAPQAGHHRPGPGLHHHFRDVPKRLHLHHLAIDKTVELMKAHVHQMPSGRNIHPGMGKGAGVKAPAANPIMPLRGGPGHDNMIAPLQIRHRCQKRRIDLVKIGIHPIGGLKRKCQAEHDICDANLMQGGAHGICVEIIHRRPQRRDQLFMV